MTEPAKTPLTKYRLEQSYGGGSLVEDKWGDWCDADDVEKLLASRDQRIAELEAEQSWLDKPHKLGWWLVKDCLEFRAYESVLVDDRHVKDPTFSAMYDRHRWRFISE